VFEQYLRRQRKKYFIKGATKCVRFCVSHARLMRFRCISINKIVPWERRRKEHTPNQIWLCFFSVDLIEKERESIKISLRWGLLATSIHAYYIQTRTLLLWAVKLLARYGPMGYMLFYTMEFHASERFIVLQAKWNPDICSSVTFLHTYSSESRCVAICYTRVLRSVKIW
jgi:hypothetical protein